MNIFIKIYLVTPRLAIFSLYYSTPTYMCLYCHLSHGKVYQQTFINYLKIIVICFINLFSNKDNVVAEEMTLKLKNLNSGDVFILDLGLQLYQVRAQYHCITIGI